MVALQHISVVALEALNKPAPGDQAKVDLFRDEGCEFVRRPQVTAKAGKHFVTEGPRFDTIRAHREFFELDFGLGDKTFKLPRCEQIVEKRQVFEYAAAKRTADAREGGCRFPRPSSECAWQFDLTLKDGWYRYGQPRPVDVEKNGRRIVEGNLLRLILAELQRELGLPCVLIRKRRIRPWSAEATGNRAIMQDHPDPVPALYDELVDRKYNRACILWSDGTHGYAESPLIKR